MLDRFQEKRIKIDGSFLLKKDFLPYLENAIIEFGMQIKKMLDI